MAYVRSGNKYQIMKNNSTLVRPGSPEIHQVHTQDTVISGDIKKCQLGTAKPGSTEKVIMMVGATGSGKTTMIDAMFNYVVNVKLKDPFRFKLVDESELAKTSTQAESQTSKVTAYTLHHQDDFAVPYTLTIVDTPGFGDTRGKEQDKKIIEQINLFFSTAGEAGIDHIDAVGFVVKATDARLTESQTYIFKSVLSLWGSNIKGNIFMFFPFSDVEPPMALVALELANIPYEDEKYYTFNNSSLFRNVQKKREKLQAEINWEMNAEGFHQFLKEHLENAEPKSLILSQSVLNLRELLETCQKGNRDDIQKITSKQEGLNAKLAKLKKDETMICQEANTHEKDIENIKREKESLNAHLTMLKKHKTICQNASKEDIEKIRREQDKLNAQFAVLQNHEIIISQDQNLEDVLNIIVNEEENTKEQLAVAIKHKTDHEKNKNYTHEEVLEKHEKVKINNKALNCSECERTCLCPCKSWFFYTSSISTWGGKCTVCFCSRKKHSKESFEHKDETQTIQKTNVEEEKMYLQKKEKLRKKAVGLANKQEKLRKMQDEIKKQQEEQRKKAVETAKEQEKKKKMEAFEITQQQEELIVKADESARKRKMEADEITKQQQEMKLKAEEMEKQLKQKEKDFENEKQKKEEKKKAAEIERKNLQKEIEGIKKKLETDHKKFFGLVMVKRLILETLHEIALKPVEKAAGRKKRDYTIYIETLILFEKEEKNEGWVRRSQQLQELQKSLDKMACLEELDNIQQMIETEENEKMGGWEERIKHLQEFQKFLSFEITAGRKGHDYIQQKMKIKEKETKEEWRKRIKHLQEFQNSLSLSFEITAGRKGHDYIQQMMKTEEKEAKKGWREHIKPLKELQESLSLEITTGWEELEYIEQMRQTEIKEGMEGWRERIQQLQGLQKKYLAKTAGWEECRYIIQMIQTEVKEIKQGWRNRTKQLQVLLLKSEELSREWNKVLDEINPDYENNTELSKDDNEKCRKSRKIVGFKEKVQIDKIEN